MEEIKVVVSDVDGVLTDGGMIYHSDGTESKKFSVYDGGGTALAQRAGLHVVAMSGEESPLVEKRCRKIGIRDIRLGVKNKIKEAKNIEEKYGVERKEIIVVVDFINDIKIMRSFKSVCPKSAPKLIRKKANRVLDVRGGKGVLWYLVKKILQKQMVFEETLEEYVKSSQK